MLWAQDVHLSQFYTAQLNLNPALGGKYDGDYRVAANYRNQWRQVNNPISSTLIAIDKKIPHYTNEIDAGILIINDQFSGFNLNTNKILLSGSYKKMLGYNELRGGVQLGMTFRSTDLAAQTFPSQWVYETGQFDPNVNSGENELNVSQGFFDVNVGFAWARTFRNIKPTLGFTLFHVNRPKDTYFNSTGKRLKMRQMMHGEVVIDVTNNISVEPKLLYMWTNKAEDALLGANLRYHIPDLPLKSLYVGALYRDGFGRNSDAIIPVIGMTYKQFDFGFSYDVNVSNLSQYNTQKSTLEFSLVYTAPIFNPTQLSIPCDRY